MIKFLEKKQLASAIILVTSTMFTFNTAYAAFEYDIPCLWGKPVEPAVNHYPSEFIIKILQDKYSRLVVMRWYFTSRGMLAQNFGLETKSHQYNWDNAAVLGKGPAYILGPRGTLGTVGSGDGNFCDLPGCYIDSDFASNKNSFGEYGEPQITFGIEPGTGAQLRLNTSLKAAVRAVAGRGNRSLLKVRMNVTQLVASGIGVAGIFLCSDVPAYQAIGFDEGIYVPGCAGVSITAGINNYC